MGVLDEAIREHLELKRRHGADLGEVAHLERRALGSTRDEDDAEIDEPAAAGASPHASAAREQSSPSTAGEQTDLATPAADQLVESAEADSEPQERTLPPQSEHLAGAAAGETIEIDMFSMIEADDESSAAVLQEDPELAFESDRGGKLDEEGSDEPAPKQRRFFGRFSSGR
jgi:hypothetical protein